MLMRSRFKQNSSASNASSSSHSYSLLNTKRSPEKVAPNCCPGSKTTGGNSKLHTGSWSRRFVKAAQFRLPLNGLSTTITSSKSKCVKFVRTFLKVTTTNFPNLQKANSKDIRGSTQSHSRSLLILT